MTQRLLPVERVATLLADERGLTTDEARARRELYGANDILEAPPRPFLSLFRDTVSDPMIGFLAATGLVYFLIGDRAEALTLALATLPLIGMDAYLHRRTRASTEGLAGRLAARAVIVRDGVNADLPAREIVPGDLLVVEAGQAFPADGIVAGGAEIQVDESTLTGESYPVRKRPLREVPGGAGEVAVPVEHVVCAGTRLLTGRARVRAVVTGGETLYGTIVRSVAADSRGRTPLQAAIGRLVGVLVVAAALFCVVLAAVRLSQGHGWADAVLSAATLAVAALPEEFPVVFTFFLGVGVFRLARRQALVRRAVSVENIGRITCICSDKTGTITEGRIVLEHLEPAQGLTESRLLSLAAAASRPDSGDPLDRAILTRAADAGAGGGPGERLATFPFTEDRRRETSIVRDERGDRLAALKGAPEIVLGMCDLPREALAEWGRRALRAMEEGHRVIACAMRPLGDAEDDQREPESGYLFAGLLLCEDPVREGVAEAIARCREGGIHPILVTGDHPATARAVASEIGLGNGAPRVITGDLLEGALAAGKPPAPAEFDVVARAVPSHKLALVRALQSGGEIVAVTGDGVNDVPALQAADIGIAMGERGTRSARDVASIVLLDDNFRTIVEAVAEGRQLFANLRASFFYLLAIHVPLVLTAALVPLLGQPLLYLPIHIVWLELIIHPSALLVFQHLPATGRLAPAAPRGGFFGRAERVRIALSGVLVTAILLILYARALSGYGDVEHARAVALVVMTTASAALTAVLSGLRTRAARWVCAGTFVPSLVLVQAPALARLVHVRPLAMDDLMLAVAGSAAAAVLPLLKWPAARARRGA